MIIFLFLRPGMKDFLMVGFGQMLPIQLVHKGLDLFVFIRNDFEQYWWKRLYLVLNVTKRRTIRPGLAGIVPVLRPCPGRLMEMSWFFVCLRRPLENSQKHVFS